MIPVTKPYTPPLDRYTQALQPIFDSQYFTNNGPMVRKLKDELEHFLGVKNLLLVSNATLGLQLAYKALGLRGKVLTTPFSFIATATSLSWENLEPVFSDIDPETYNLSPGKLKQKNLKDVSAVLPVHVFGNPCDHENIQKFCSENKLKLIYDAAHAFDVKCDGKSVLNWGDISILSFHATKMFHTVEGGAMIINDDETYRKVARLINFGFNLDASDVVDAGINAKMSEVHASMGLVVLESFPEIKKKRKEIFDYYQQKLCGKMGFQKIATNVEWNYSYCPVLFSSEEKLVQAVARLNAEQIFPRRYFHPSIDQFSYYKKDVFCENSSEISKRILCLPSYHELTRAEQEKIIDLL